MRKYAALLVIVVCTVLFGACSSGTDTVIPTDIPMETMAPEETGTTTPVPESTAIPTPEPTATSTPEPTSAPSPTPTSTPTATPEPTATPTPEPTAASTPTPTPTATPTPAPTPIIPYTIFEWDYGTLYTKQEIKVYSTPHAMGEFLGTVAKGEAVRGLAKRIENDWVLINYNGMEGYTPACNIGLEPPTVQEIASDEVMIPDVSGMSQEEATRVLEECGLIVPSYTVMEDSLTYADGTIISTYPAYGTVVKKNSTVSLTLSWGIKPWSSFTIDNMTLPTESSTKVSVVKSTVLEQTNERVYDYSGPFVAGYYKTTELEYSDGAILRVTYRMEDSTIQEVSKIEVVKRGDSEEAVEPKLTEECYKLLNMDYVATYPLGHTLLMYAGDERTPYSTSEYVAEFATDGSYVVMIVGNMIHTQLPNYDAVEPIYGPLFWTNDVVKTTKPVNSYEENGDTYEVYEDSTIVRYQSDGKRIDVTYADKTGYSVFFTVRSGENTISEVTFYDNNREELYTIHRRISVEPYICLWYRYVGEKQVQIVNTDGTPVEKYKDIIFDDEGFRANNGGGAVQGMTKRREFETPEGTISLTTYKFTEMTVDGEYIVFDQDQFPLEDY